MLWQNSNDRYGAVHRALHWLIALAVLVMLVMGFIMGDIPRGPDKLWVYSIHKSIGVTILFFMIVRLVWKFVNWRRPKALPTHKPWERLLAGIVHWGLYVLLIAMPLAGWLGTAAANSTVNWFGFFVVPNPIGPNPDLREVFFEAHKLIAWGIAGLLVLHIAGAVKHAVIDRDDTLLRMVPFGKPRGIVMIAALMMLATPAMAETWVIDPAKSTLEINATQEGGKFTGRFSRFSGTINFDPAKPADGNGQIVIDLTSFESGNAERDASVQDKDWFDSKSATMATYKIMSFERPGPDELHFVAKGALMLKGVEKPLDIAFSFEVDDKAGVRTAHAAGDTIFQRLDFGVGTGSWADPSMVGTEIGVHMNVYAPVKAEQP